MILYFWMNKIPPQSEAEAGFTQLRFPKKNSPRAVGRPQCGGNLLSAYLPLSSTKTKFAILCILCTNNL